VKKMNTPTKTLLVICGPTCCGKTDLAVEQAKKLTTEIVSADSRQFYKEMSIGTAKPTNDELQGIKCHLVDFLSIHQNYTISDYEKDALDKINKIFEKSDTAILCGGSGLFIKAVCEGLDKMPPADENLRKQLAELWEKGKKEKLISMLNELDSTTVKNIDINNPRRVIRALEVSILTGKPFSTFKNKKTTKRDFQVRYLFLNPPRVELYDRINQRVDRMLENGLVKEVENLLPFRHLTPLQTVGYQELFRYFDKEISLVTATEMIKRNTRRYAKRQITWFKKVLAEAPGTPIPLSRSNP